MRLLKIGKLKIWAGTRVLDRKYFTEEEFNNFYKENETIGKQISGFMEYLLHSPIKGQKFNQAKKG